MPFITEEVWQQLPKPTGTPGSIMITMYPVADSSLIDETAEKQLDLVRNVVTAVRNLRAEYNIPPSTRLDVTVISAYDETRQLLEQQAETMKRLGRIEPLVITARNEIPSGSLVAVAGEAQVCVKLSGAIDPAAEEARLQKELAKIDKERAGLSGRLANKSFVERAPAEVVEKDRARLAELDEKIAKVNASMERLKKL
jgi:valyl-tRNA synthetase